MLLRTTRLYPRFTAGLNIEKMAAYRTTSFISKTILEDLVILNNSSKFEFVSIIWPNSGLTIQTFHDNEYTSLVEYIREELSRLRDHQSEFAADTIDGTVDLIGVLRKNADKSQEEVLHLLRNRFQDVNDAAILRSLELTTRILLTINIHTESVAIGPVQANVRTIEWPSKVSLKDLVQSQFQSSHKDEGSDAMSINAQLDPSFTASFLVNTCGVKISWTHNMADHLLFDKRRRIITVYEHKICLLNHSKDPDSLIPHEILHEAIDTLNLLFPFGDRSTRELMHQEQKLPLYRLGLCDRPRLITLADYDVWRTRLIDLVEVFNEPPRDLKQLLNDRRNVSGWATFCIGILVLILTVVSIAFGTVSTVFAIKQYNLALAQACSAEGAAQLLPNYCK